MPYYPAIKNLGDIARFHGRQRPNATAFIFGDRTTTYRAYDEHTNQIANGLLQPHRLAATPRGFAVLDSLIQDYI